MTTLVWNKIESLAKYIETQFQQNGNKVQGQEEKYNWYNSIYTSDSFRRAHIEIVDNRETHKIYILHCTIFPHYNDPGPIWGFDAVCGPNKITGAFHDFSSAGDPNHSMMKWFSEQSKKLNWNKERTLPDWAKAIFSPSMIAAGNIQNEEEIDQLCNVAKTTLEYYIKNIGYTQESGFDFHMAQDRYCYYQKQNPHVINSMVSMGVPKDTMTSFVNEVLFPESVLV
jgi:hypothetical protein